MTYKVFSERLNNELSAIGMPEHFPERIEIFAKVFKTPKFKAEALLNGHTLPDKDLLNLLSQELEVSSNWLLGDETSTH